MVRKHIQHVQAAFSIFWSFPAVPVESRAVMSSAEANRKFTFQWGQKCGCELLNSSLPLLKKRELTSRPIFTSRVVQFNSFCLRGMAKLVMPLPEIKFHFWITIHLKRLRFNLIFQLAACKAIRKGLLQPVNPSYVGHMAQLSSFSFVNYLMLPSRCSHRATLAPSTRLPAPWRPSDKITQSILIIG